MTMRRYRSIVRQTGRRGAAGYALVAILTVSVFATMLLLALAGMTVSLSRSEGFYKQREYALVGADVALDYTRKSLTKSLNTGVPSLLEPAGGETERISELPTNLIPQGIENCKVLIRVRRLSPAEILAASQKSSPAISHQWNPNNHKNVADWKYGNDWMDFSIPALSYYWMVEVTSYRGLVAVSTRSMLAPDIGATLVSSSSSSSSTKDTLFVEGIVADQEVNLSPPSDGYLDVLAPGDGFSPDQVSGSVPNTAFKTAIQSNNLVTTSNVTNLYGDLRVTNPLGSSDSVARGSNTTVWGRVQTNSVTGSDGLENSLSGFQGTPGDLLSGTDNVWAFSDYFSNPDSFWTTGMREGLNETSPVAILPSDSANQVSPNPVPVGGDASARPEFPEPPPSGTEAPISGDITVAPGVYKTSWMDSRDAIAKLILNDSGGSTTIFIDDGPSSPRIDPSDGLRAKLNIDSKWFQNNGAAKDLQIYYGGSEDLTVTLDGELAGDREMKAFIYAPNAKVTTQGFGEFEGAIVAKKLNINQYGDFRVDPSASSFKIDRSSQIGGSGGAGVSGERLPTHYRIASWQQVSGSLVHR